MNNENRAVGSTGQTASKASEQVATRAQDAAERLKTSAHEQIEAVRGRAESGREQAAERIRRVGTALRGLGRDLRDHDDAFVAKYADSISDGIERAASYVGSLEPGTLASDATRFARNKPAWFFGGAFLVGLAAGRFLKSSRPETMRDDDRWPARERFDRDDRFDREDRFRSEDRFGMEAGQRYARNDDRFGEDISTRGVFDTDERTLP